jgi:hypothetical protein
LRFLTSCIAHDVLKMNPVNVCTRAGCKDAIKYIRYRSFAIDHRGFYVNCPLIKFAGSFFLKMPLLRHWKLTEIIKMDQSVEICDPRLFPTAILLAGRK